MSDKPERKRAKTEATSQMPVDDGQMLVAAPAVQENACDIFKLDVDCCEELFEWLSIEDLHSLGQTCKRMHRIAGMFFRQNYPCAHIFDKNDGIYYCANRLDGFTEYVEHINCYSRTMDMAELEKIGAKCKSLKEMSFMTFDETIEKSEILGKIESLQITGDTLNEQFLDFCPNLKRILIEVGYSHTDNWLFKLHKCPKLEFIKLTGLVVHIDGMERFFDQVPHLQSIEMNWRFILKNKNAFLRCNVKLIKLIIDFCDNDDEGDLKSICPLLNRLYARGFYKRLHLSQLASGISQKAIDAMVGLRGFEALDIQIENDVNWPVMESLKKIWIDDFDVADFTKIAKNLPNLQRIHLPDSTIDAALPFIRSSKHLTQIRLVYLSEGPLLNENILDLPALNKQRAKLAGASKVTIYLPEEIFLATKFAGSVSYSLIEIKRHESMKSKIEWYLDYKESSVRK